MLVCAESTIGPNKITSWGLYSVMYLARSCIGWYERVSPNVNGAAATTMWSGAANVNRNVRHILHANIVACEGKNSDHWIVSALAEDRTHLVQRRNVFSRRRPYARPDFFLLQRLLVPEIDKIPASNLYPASKSGQSCSLNNNRVRSIDDWFCRYCRKRFDRRTSKFPVRSSSHVSSRMIRNLFHIFPRCKNLKVTLARTYIRNCKIF